LAATKVFKEHVTASHRGRVEIGIAVVIDIRKRGRNTYLVFNRYSGLFGDVLKPTVT
jgi:hypothetical protein